MPTVGKLTALAQDKVVSTTFDYEGEAVRLEFAGGKITGADIQGYIAATDVEQPGLLTTLLARVIAGWDLTHEDGSEFAVTEDNLNTLPLGFQAACLQAIGKAAGASGEGQGSFAGG